MDARRGALIRSYTYGVAPLGYSTRGASFTYHADSLGSTVELSDDRSASAGSYRYSPYGEDLPSGAASNSEADSNPIRFSGQYLDQDSGLYYMRAREYDPASGRFLEVDPKEAEAGEPDLSSYLYAEDDPTLLTDPSGLDPRLGNATLNCKRNKLLCSFIYGTGYTDGATGYAVRRAFAKLYWNGIEYLDAYAAATGKGRVINASNGSGGPGLYFVGGGQSRRIRPPGDASCGWRCSFGFSITQVFGCGSTAGCLVQDVLFFVPGPSKGSRLMERFPKLMKLLKLERKAQRVEEGVWATEEATGQLHHVISRQIAKALEEHPNLAGMYRARDARYVSRAADAASHRGYQAWHREVDREVVEWLGAHGEATPERFDRYLRKLYDSPELKKRFPNAF
jgi:RHS repeat-associated protein